ncbi:MAG: ABC transporter permease subunit [Bacteroidetes bacterium]|nr:ABC transporter permease subunit [Bacteroidota bacterium]
MKINKLIYRLIFLGITILIVPALPILIIFLGTNSPQYVIQGTLNMSYEPNISAWNLYLEAIKNLISLNLGNSTSSGLPVVQELYSGFYESFKIILPAIFFSYLIGTCIGILRKNKETKNYNNLNFLFYIPMIVFSYLFLWFSDSFGIDFTSGIRYIYAILILSIYPIFIISKSFEMKYKETIKSDFYMFHISSGFSKKQILNKFLIRYFGIEYFSFFENLVIYMFSFIYFVEAPFAINGMGYKFVLGIQRFDYPLTIGFCIVALIIFSVINIIIDFTKLKIDIRKI